MSPGQPRWMRSAREAGNHQGLPLASRVSSRASSQTGPKRGRALDTSAGPSVAPVHTRSPALQHRSHHGEGKQAPAGPAILRDLADHRAAGVRAGSLPLCPVGRPPQPGPPGAALTARRWPNAARGRRQGHSCLLILGEGTEVTSHAEPGPEPQDQSLLVPHISKDWPAPSYPGEAWD